MVDDCGSVNEQPELEQIEATSPVPPGTAWILADGTLVQRWPAALAQSKGSEFLAAPRGDTTVLAWKDGFPPRQAE